MRAEWSWSWLCGCLFTDGVGVGGDLLLLFSFIFGFLLLYFASDIKRSGVRRGVLFCLVFFLRFTNITGVPRFCFLFSLFLSFLSELSESLESG